MPATGVAAMPNLYRTLSLILAAGVLGGLTKARVAWVFGALHG
jgi:hypothetical protein